MKNPGLKILVGLSTAVVILLILFGPGRDKGKETGNTGSSAPTPAAVSVAPAAESGITPEAASSGLLRSIAAGDYHSAAIAQDGTVLVAGDNNFEQCNVAGWTDVISLTGSTYTTAALRADGSIYISGPSWMMKGYENFYDIIDIDDNSECVVGLRADGTVATNRDSYYDAVRDWTGIVDISAGEDHVAGLRANGTVIVEVWDIDTDPNGKLAESWSNITAIASGIYHLAGLREDGTVVSTLNYSYDPNPVSEWTDIVQIAAGCNFTVGLRADGTVVCTSGNYAVSGWTDIVQIAAGDWHVLGLRADGTVLATGDNDDGRADVQGWRNIRIYD